MSQTRNLTAGAPWEQICTLSCKIHRPRKRKCHQSRIGSCTFPSTKKRHCMNTIRMEEPQLSSLSSAYFLNNHLKEMSCTEPNPPGVHEKHCKHHMECPEQSLRGTGHRGRKRSTTTPVHKDNSLCHIRCRHKSMDPGSVCPFAAAAKLSTRHRYCPKAIPKKRTCHHTHLMHRSSIKIAAASHIIQSFVRKHKDGRAHKPETTNNQKPSVTVPCT